MSSARHTSNTAGSFHRAHTQTPPGPHLEILCSSIHRTSNVRRSSLHLYVVVLDRALYELVGVTAPVSCSAQPAHRRACAALALAWLFNVCCGPAFLLALHVRFGSLSNVIDFHASRSLYFLMRATPISIRSPMRSMSLSSSFSTSNPRCFAISLTARWAS